MKDKELIEDRLKEVYKAGMGCEKLSLADEAVEIIEMVRGSEWVSVEDELPDETGNYFVYLKVGSMSPKHVVTTMRFQKHEHNSKFMEGDWQKVINWQPLPSPPTNKGDKE